MTWLDCVPGGRVSTASRGGFSAGDVDRDQPRSTIHE
jgi:hypothetical protein